MHKSFAASEQGSHQEKRNKDAQLNVKLSKARVW